MRKDIVRFHVKDQQGKVLENTFVIRDYCEKTEGQIKQELIKFLVSQRVDSGWYFFYLYETNELMEVLNFTRIKKDNFIF